MIFAFVASSVELDKRTYASDSYARLVWFAMETKGEPTTRCTRQHDGRFALRAASCPDPWQLMRMAQSSLAGDRGQSVRLTANQRLCSHVYELKLITIGELGVSASGTPLLS
ncbi:hypothetical protein NPIL_646731 [Nephila pilipes]|uniref:Uncharacterized protein n=1 Tax=Nephila pilipes TaxID=299642 RepID=A0A8X6IIZ0_NEPPI|nr:hypothetical protein NPIL_646731 [Nephila pilipes]